MFLLEFFYKSCNHLCNCVSGCHSIRHSVASESDPGSVQSWDLLISLTVLVPRWKAFGTATARPASKHEACGRNVGSPCCVAESLLAWRSCFSPASSYSLVWDCFSCGFGLQVCTHGFHFLYSFPFTQTKKGIIMRYFCICLRCQAMQATSLLSYRKQTQES